MPIVDATRLGLGVLPTLLLRGEISTLSTGCNFGTEIEADLETVARGARLFYILE